VVITLRLWHKDLVEFLPQLQLISQWRECCCIAKNIAEKGTPNHILVNRVMDYPMEHFYRYCGRVFAFMVDKGYMPYRDTFDHKGPYVYLLNMLGEKISYLLCIID
jgi:uncharacterized protein (TIGR02328 family)